MNQPAIVALSLSLLACGQAPPELAPLKLTVAGQELVMQAPKGASTDKRPHESLEVQAGPTFRLAVDEGFADLADTTKRCVGAEYKNCQVVIEQPDVVITRWKQLSKLYHVPTVNVTAGGGEFHCSAEATSRTEEIDLEHAQRMVQSCKSLTPAE